MCVPVSVSSLLISLVSVSFSHVFCRLFVITTPTKMQSVASCSGDSTLPEDEHTCSQWFLANTQHDLMLNQQVAQRNPNDDDTRLTVQIQQWNAARVQARLAKRRL